MPDLLVSRALLTRGWASDVLLTTDDAGVLTRVSGGAPASASAERIEGVAVPGVPNLHSHAFQRALAGLAERRGPGGADSFWTWREAMYAFLTRLGPEDVEAIAAQAYLEMLRAGYTAVAEFHYLHRDPRGSPYDDPAEMSLRLLAAADAVGIGLALLPSLYVAGDFGGAPPAEAQRRFLLDASGARDLLDGLAPSFGAASAALRRLGLALHSLRAVPPEELAAGVEAARTFGEGTPIHIHVAEQRKEVEACLAWSGQRPVEWLLDRTPVDGRWCLVHATHLSPEEVGRLAHSGAVAGLCPSTEANLGDGVFRLPDFVQAGGTFGVGSDSNVSTSPVEELRWLEYGQRLATGARNVASGFPHASTGRSLLVAAVSGGARAVGAAGSGLEVGARADLVVLDPEHPALLGRSDDALLDSWVFSGNASPVRHVVVGGRVVIRDGRHPREAEIFDAYRRALRRTAS